MPTLQEIEVKKLSLDLKNFRTVPQPDEENAINAMIHIHPDQFWALMDSILTDGFLEAENIFVLRSVVKGKEKLVVKEGNRRIGILKIVLGHLKADNFPIPDNLRNRIATFPSSLKTAAQKVPCRIYNVSEVAVIDRIINLTHAKAEKAGRDHWTAVARARHNRDAKKGIEIGLDLLEKYLIHGRNLNAIQKERWAGAFPLSILDNAVNRLAARLDCSKAAELPAKYPKVKYRDELESIILGIGSGIINTDHVRADEFGVAYGIPLLPSATSNSTSSTNNSTSNATGTNSQGSNTGTATASAPTTGTTSQTPAKKGKAKASGSKAFALNDPRAVIKKLKLFVPVGKDREKIVTLRDEALRLKIDKNALAFCFLLRSMFEISAKIYCKEQGIPTQRPRSKKDPVLVDKSLAEMLISVSDHLTQGKNNTPLGKVLLSAKSELSQPDRLLSVTSMNQLVHHPTFSIAPGDICILFMKVYPLLEAMN